MCYRSFQKLQRKELKTWSAVKSKNDLIQGKLTVRQNEIMQQRLAAMRRMDHEKHTLQHYNTIADRDIQLNQYEKRVQHASERLKNRHLIF